MQPWRTINAVIVDVDVVAEVFPAGTVSCSDDVVRLLLAGCLCRRLGPGPCRGWLLSSVTVRHQRL